MTLTRKDESALLQLVREKVPPERVVATAARLLAARMGLAPGYGASYLEAHGARWCERLQARALPRFEVRCGDATAFLQELPSASADALVCDPPAGIGFMGHAWDSDRGGLSPWVAWLAQVLGEARRTLRPGAHALLWALPRRSHWTALAIELAGYEIRDVITHVQGQGMPKHRSLLKPAAEHWILCRAPGPLRPLAIEACRTESGRYPANLIFTHSAGCVCLGDKTVRSTGAAPAARGGLGFGSTSRGTRGARQSYGGAAGLERVPLWRCAPGCPVLRLGEQSGVTRSASGKPFDRVGIGYGGGGKSSPSSGYYGDEGTAERFFHQLPCEDPFLYCPKDRAGRRHNPHPTAKPVPLMRLLCRLVTPPGGRVLDPFVGSGTTGAAALLEGLSFVGCDEEPAYVSFAQARLAQIATESPP